jgi:signal transduction histidine kinase
MTLTRRLLLGGFAVLLVGAVAMGTGLGATAERRVIDHEGELFALYVGSVLADDASTLASGGSLSDSSMVALDKLMHGTGLGERLAALRVWSRDGRVLYSTDLTEIGPRPALPVAVVAALRGEAQLQKRMADSGAPNPEGALRSGDIAIYTPVRDAGTGSVLAVSEIRQRRSVLADAIDAARLQDMTVVVGTSTVMYLLLAYVVRRSSNNLVDQQVELEKKVAELTNALADSENARERVSRAARRTTSLNQHFLNRLSADLHDGPGQGLSLAVMRLGTLSEACSTCHATTANDSTVSAEFMRVQEALQSSLQDMRAISKGLHLPDLEVLSVADIVRRAVRDFERSSGATIKLTVDNIPEEAPLPVKITVFRLIQESLANGLRHGHAVNQQIDLSTSEGQLRVVVRDDGGGFDAQQEPLEGHLGLPGMRERVELLGGTFLVWSALGQGAIVRADLPLVNTATADE